MASRQSSETNGTSRFTQKEKDLLELLEQNPGRCFSRTYLLERIWGYSSAAKTRTVDVHISRLRKKLGPRSGVSIHTVVRQGYVLERNAPRASSNRIDHGIMVGTSRAAPVNALSA